MLCGDPENTPHLVLVSLLCIGVCSDVISIHKSSHTHTPIHIFHKIHGISWPSEDLLALLHAVSSPDLLRTLHRLIYQSVAPCGTVFVMNFAVNYHQTLGVTWPHIHCRNLTFESICNIHGVTFRHTVFLILTAIRCSNLIGPENFICCPHSVVMALDSLHKTRQSNATLP